MGILRRKSKNEDAKQNSRAGEKQVSEEQLEAIRHTLAHVLAASVLELYPGSENAIGPAIENGFYQDFEINGELSDKDLRKIEKLMRKKVREWKSFEARDTDMDEVRRVFTEIQDNKYKRMLAEEFISEGKTITLQNSLNSKGDIVFWDLCKGGHTEDPNRDINPEAFKLERVAGAYWKGDEKNKMLTRIYGLAFATKEELGEHINNQEEAKLRDHRKLGKELDLFIIDEQVGKGLPMWTPKGTIIKHELEKYVRQIEKRYGYQHVETPYIGHERLYQTSGHLEHFPDMWALNAKEGDDQFYLRPMACPHHIRMYQRKNVSYKELPIRYAEIADYNRYEKSGELVGMIRVRKFQLTDSHVFVSPEGLKQEFKHTCNLVSEAMKKIGLSEVVTYRFSKRDPNNKEMFHDNDELWDKSESVMKEVLDEIGFDYVTAEGEAAFYGPKLDVQGKNVNGKEDTLFTIQIDYLLPQRFDMKYTDKDGQDKQPVMIHRSVIGALERTFAFMLEHYGGAFPLWLSPVQVKVLPITDTQHKYAEEVEEKLSAAGFRVEVDPAPESLGKKIREAKLQKIPYILVLGEKEMKADKVTVESRDEGELGVMSLGDLLKRFAKESE